MAYSDIINAVKLHGDALNKTALDWGNVSNRLSYTAPKGGPQGVNPWSSEAYVPQTYRDIARGYAPVQDPRSIYNQATEGLTGWDKTLMKGAKGISGYQIGSELSPFIQKGGTSIYNAITGTQQSLPTMKNFNLGPAAAVYSAFGTDNNPYTLTKQEKLGTTVSTMMGAHQLSKLAGLSGAGAAASTGAIQTGALAGVNPYVMIGALLLGGLFNKRRKKKVQKANWDAGMEVQKKQQEQYAERSEKLENMRDDMLSQQMSQMHAADAAKYTNQYGGNYNILNRLQADEGMKFTPKELNKIAKAGRNGDTMLAHINPQEAALLKALGGSGTINPYTNLPEYGYGSAISSILSPVSSALSSVGNVITPIASPIFGAAQSALDPVASNIINPAVSAAGGLVNQAVNTAASGAQQAIRTGGNLATNVAQNVVNPIVQPVLDPVMNMAQNIAAPVMDMATTVANPVMGGLTNLAGTVIEGTLDAAQNIGHNVLIPGVEALFTPVHNVVSGLLGWGDPVFSPYGETGTIETVPGELKRQELKRLMEAGETSGLQIKGQDLAKLQKSQADAYAPGDWVSSKENPFIAPNVEEEIDYAAKGMKYKYDQGGKMNIVAEFTGNELIVNDQNRVEKGLASGNYSMAASPIRRAMKKRQLTPGPETHRGNPMPVDSEGNIYAGGGKLKFKVNKGAGVYDHATDQFKPTMTDKEIAMVAKNNIAKWKANGMA